MNETSDFAEIERLKGIIEKQNEIIKQRDAEIQLYRNKSVAVVFNRSPIMKRLKHYFIRWVSKTSQLRDEEELAVRNMELKVGLQYVQTQEDGYREATIKNRTLNNVLCLTIYYYKWKLTNLEQKLTIELKKSNNERKFLISELISLKRLLIANNKLESDIVEMAESNGLSLIKSLNSNKNILINSLSNTKYSNQPNENESANEVSCERDISDRKSLVPFK